MRRRLPTGPFECHGRESWPSIVSAVLLTPVVVVFIGTRARLEDAARAIRRVIGRVRRPQ